MLEVIVYEWNGEYLMTWPWRMVNLSNRRVWMKESCGCVHVCLVGWCMMWSVVIDDGYGCGKGFMRSLQYDDVSVEGCTMVPQGLICWV